MGVKGKIWKVGTGTELRFLMRRGKEGMDIGKGAQLILDRVYTLVLWLELYHVKAD